VSSISSKFYEWAKYLKIISKEKGYMPFSPQLWFKSQKYVIQQILDEIDRNSEVREFLILKSRQQGITTVLFALDLYWVMAVKGIKLGFLCHSYEARPKLREIIRQFYLTLPQSMKVPCIVDNREMMHFRNGSEIQFLHVSSRESSKQTVARSQALTCLHATEAAFYNVNDPQDEVLKSLLISLSKTNPARYTILESTANGFNSFYDRWQGAKKNPSQKTIFIGWYLRDDYRIKKSNPLFQVYGYPPTREERSKIKLVKELYGFDIDIEQLACFRKIVETDFNGDMNYALQEMPWYEDEAFRLSGYKYFNPEKLTELMKNVQKHKPLYFNIYANRNGIYIEKGSEIDHNLKIFEFPDERESYFIGADPSYGASPESDNAVISIWKGYKDKVIQVAEYCDNSIGLIEFAKLCLFFGSFYQNAYINIEVQGPGRMVLKEIDNLKANSYDLGEIVWNAKENVNLDKIKANIKYIKEYLYYRGDSLRRSYVRHWQTTSDTKEALMSQYKSLFEMGLMEIKSKDLAEEMSFFIRDGSYLGAESGRHDDRIIASAIAVEYWRRYAYLRLPAESQKQPVNIEKQNNYLKSIGLYNVISPFIGQKG
jgi:hypothetical protein